MTTLKNGLTVASIETHAQHRSQVGGAKWDIHGGESRPQVRGRPSHQEQLAVRTSRVWSSPPWRPQAGVWAGSEELQGSPGEAGRPGTCCGKSSNCTESSEAVFTQGWRNTGKDISLNILNYIQNFHFVKFEWPLSKLLPLVQIFTKNNIDKDPPLSLSTSTKT